MYLYLENFIIQKSIILDYLLEEIQIIMKNIEGFFEIFKDSFKEM